MFTMWFTVPPPLKLCIQAAVFCSTVLARECQADDIPGYLWRNDDESIHIYRTEVPWKPIELDTGKNTFAIVAWTAVLSVAVSVAAIICLCCLCWKFYPMSGRRRQSSNAVLVPPRSRTNTVMGSQAENHVDRRIRTNSRRGSSYNTGVHNLAFSGNTRDLSPSPKIQDVPPAYSIVISETPSDDKVKPSYPPVSETKKVETPPPAYITVAPFQ